MVAVPIPRNPPNDIIAYALAGYLVDHQVVDRAQPIAPDIEYVSALDFIGGDKGRGLLDGVHRVFSLAVVQN